MIDPKKSTLSYGEAKRGIEGGGPETPGCRCRPTNVLMWELSEADTTDCPVHGRTQEGSNADQAD